MATLVTCYYPIKSKFPPAHYIHWAQDFLSLEAKIVLFTEPNLSSLFRSLHKCPDKLHIIELPFEQLEAWGLWKDQWIQQHNLDPEKAIHSPELYAIWAQKAFFIQRVILENPFGTDYFFWCDIGAFREGIDPVIQTSFPDSRYLLANQILLNSITPLEPVDTLRKADGIKGNFLHVNRIVGGLWGGGRIGCLRWLGAYRVMLERYFAAGRFAGKDQSVMLSAYLEDNSLAHVVKCNITGVNVWFYLTQLCSSRNDIVCELDTTYTSVEKSIVSVSIMGGLGNQMFQIATAYAHAKRCGAALQLLREKKEQDGRATYWDSALTRCKLYLTDTLPECTHVYERGPTMYSELPTSGNMYLEGYWQSPKYFSEFRDEIRALYKPSDSVLMNLFGKYGELLGKRGQVVVVHARRTDYLKNDWNIQYHGPLDVAYYKRAVEAMLETVENPVFLLCSDDPLFWLEVIPHVPALQTFPAHILAGEDDVHTLGLLLLFQHFIIANSTFSWWAAWLSSAKRVYAPAHWFGPKGPQHYDDIYDPSWIRID